MSQSSAPRRPLEHKRILVVEDEIFLALWIEDILTEAGAVVIGPAASVNAALQLLDLGISDGGIDAAVLDYNLSGTISLPVATQLARRGVPFLIQSAYHDVPHFEGVQLISKPYPPEDLVSALIAIAQSSPSDTVQPCRFHLLLD